MQRPTRWQGEVAFGRSPFLPRGKGVVVGEHLDEQRDRALCRLAIGNQGGPCARPDRAADEGRAGQISESLAVS